MASLELVSVRCTSAVALLLSLCVSYGAGQSCPTLPAHPGSSPPDLAGLRLFIDPTLDPEISKFISYPSRTERTPPLSAGSAVPTEFQVVRESGPQFPFSSLDAVKLGPAIPSTFTNLPLHAVANQEVCATLFFSLTLFSSWVVTTPPSLPVTLHSQNPVS